MSDLSHTFNEILTNRQSQRKKFHDKLEKVNYYFNKYTRLSVWIADNKDSLLKFNPEVETSLNDLDYFVNNQISLITTLSGSVNSGQGIMQQLLSRIERSWVSFSAIGAKRQGKGHMLSTLLGLKPENDIFLARAGKPCTASVVTLYQGPKREAIFNENGTFKEWNTIAKNTAFVYFHTFDSIARLIQDYFSKLNIASTFHLTQKNPSAFISECTRLISTVEGYVSNDVSVEYILLMR